jgi:hypothetical protein
MSLALGILDHDHHLRQSFNFYAVFECVWVSPYLLKAI